MKKIFKALLLGVLCVMILSIIPSCGSDSSDSGKKEYVKDSEVSKVFKSPDEYEGKYIWGLTAQITYNTLQIMKKTSR